MAITNRFVSEVYVQNYAQPVGDYALISDIPTTLPANGGNADTVNGISIRTITQTDYNELTTKDLNTLYLIIEG